MVKRCNLGGWRKMLIGELVIKTECSRDTLRFYEKLGLIEGKRGLGRTNTYKHYADQMVDRVLLIKQAKLLGFTLAEIKRLVASWQAKTLSLAAKVNIFQEKIVLVDQRIAELKQVKKYLQRKLKGLKKCRNASLASTRTTNSIGLLSSNVGIISTFGISRHGQIAHGSSLRRAVPKCSGSC